MKIYSSVINVAACVCAKDGVISNAEEKRLYEIILERFPESTQATFEVAMTDYFNSSKQLEEYMEEIEDGELREYVMMLCEESAGADGLDLSENIALEKLRLKWGL